MEQKMFQNEDGKVFYRKYNLDDLLEGIYLGNIPKHLAKFICMEFFKSMTKDMIMDNDYFMFPEMIFGRMYVRDIASVNHPNYQYDIDKAGDVVYQPVTNVNKKKVFWYYNIRFLGETEKMFQKEIANNHNY